METLLFAVICFVAGLSLGSQYMPRPDGYVEKPAVHGVEKSTH